MKNLNPIEYRIANPGSSLNETNDCAVRAIANVTDTPYYQVHDVFKWAGRKERGFTSLEVMYEIMQIFGISIMRPISRKICHSTFIKNNKSGNFVAISNNHAWAIKNGMIYDSFKVGLRTQIKVFGEYKNPLTK